MDLDDGTMVVRIGSNPIISTHGKFGTKLGQECDKHLLVICDHETWQRSLMLMIY